MGGVGDRGERVIKRGLWAFGWDEKDLQMRENQDVRREREPRATMERDTLSEYMAALSPPAKRPETPSTHSQCLPGWKMEREEKQLGSLFKDEKSQMLNEAPEGHLGPERRGSEFPFLARVPSFAEIMVRRMSNCDQVLPPRQAEQNALCALSCLTS